MILYNVTKTSIITKMHPQTLRHYEKIGLVVPQRTAGGVRRYNDYDIQRLLSIRELTSRGVNLEGVAIILSQQEQINLLKRQMQVNDPNNVWTGASNGEVNFKSQKPMSLLQKMKLWRKMRKNTPKPIQYQMLQIEYREYL